MINKEYFSKIDTHNKAYVLGMLAADGTVREKYVARICLIDKEILEDISCDIYNGENRVTKIKSNGIYSLNICSKDLVIDLHNHGIIPNKTDKLEHLMNVPDEFYCSFVLGYFDGDGSVTTASKNKSIKILGTYNFLSTMQEKVENLCGVEGKIYFCKNHLYRIEYSGSNKIKPFIKWLYSGNSFSLERKKVKSLFLLNDKTLKEKINISVEEYYKSGLSKKEFSEKTGINYSTIRNRIKRRKIETFN